MVPVEKKLKSAKDIYKLEENDILFLSGPYAGKRVNEIWSIDDKSKDYVFRQFYNCSDINVLSFLKRLLCK